MCGFLLLISGMFCLLSNSGDAVSCWLLGCCVLLCLVVPCFLLIGGVLSCFLLRNRDGVSCRLLIGMLWLAVY